MPRNVRNFWITAKIDGRDGPITVGGPQSKDGGFTLTVQQRSNGGIVTALRLTGRVRMRDGKLLLDVDDERGITVYSRDTNR